MSNVRVTFFPSADPSKAMVQGVHFDLDDAPEGAIDAEYVEPQHIPLKHPVHYGNPETGVLWYEYEDREATREEEITILKAQLADKEDRLSDIEMIVAELLGL